jgi:DnaK suppressor protein
MASRRIAMTTKRGWRAWLAAAVPVGLAGITTLAFGRGISGSFPLRGPGGAAGNPALSGAPPASWPGLPPGKADRKTAGPGGRAAGAPEGLEPGLLLPAWRTLLEARWQQRLSTVTRLSVAYHDAAERLDGGHRAGGMAEPSRLRLLMEEAVAARRALCDTEEALARLSAGTYGLCEQCGAAILTARLGREPEARYCEPCVQRAARGTRATAAGGTGATTGPATVARGSCQAGPVAGTPGALAAVP